MSAFSIIAFPMLTCGLVLFALYYKKRDRNYLVPGFVMLAAALVIAVLGREL